MLNVCPDTTDVGPDTPTITLAAYALCNGGLANTNMLNKAIIVKRKGSFFIRFCLLTQYN